MTQQTIWKSTLQPIDVQEIEVPEGAEMLCAREQHEQICVWYKCNPNAKRVKRMIGVVGTGHPCPNRDRYIGTASLMGGALILHVFERVQ